MTPYVNEGPDKRPLGKVGGWIQSALSFRSAWEPLHVMVAFPPYVSIAIPKLWTNPRRYATLRFGWRYDKHWGDKTPCGNCQPCQDQQPWNCEAPILNPPPHGGYIFDVIVKLDFDRVVPY